MAMRDRADQPLTFRRPAARASHVGRGPRLVEEHQTTRIELRLELGPRLTGLLDVLAILLGGAQVFF